VKSYIFEKKKNAMIQVKIVIEDELDKKIEVSLYWGVSGQKFG
jgi:hypothetical protein